MHIIYIILLYMYNILIYSIICFIIYVCNTVYVLYAYRHYIVLLHVYAYSTVYSIIHIICIYLVHYIVLYAYSTLYSIQYSII